MNRKRVEFIKKFILVKRKIKLYLFPATLCFVILCEILIIIYLTKNITELLFGYNIIL